MEKFTSIKHWAIDERPREKLANKGSETLSNAELLAILINTGTKNRSALDIAKELLGRCEQNLLELSQLSLTEIKKVNGIGEQKAITLLAALELGKRRQLSAAIERNKIITSRDAFERLNPHFLGKTIESFYIIYLNNANKILSIENISHGGITSTVVDVRVIFKRALEIAAVTQIIIAHNHPSGSLNPSEADKRLTHQIKEAGIFLQIKLLDHLIIAGNTFYSFADSGIL